MAHYLLIDTISISTIIAFIPKDPEWLYDPNIYGAYPQSFCWAETY